MLSREEFRRWLGKRVVVVYRKGGRIKQQRRFDSEYDGDIPAIQRSLGLAMLPNTPVGPELIGKGWIGLLPWQDFDPERQYSEVEKLDFSCPVRVADVAENSVTGITTVFLESV